MNYRITVLEIGFSILIFSCSNSQVNVSEKGSKVKSIDSVGPNATSSDLKVKLNYSNLIDLISYYNKKTDSIFKIRNKLYKNNVQKRELKDTAVETIEVIYYGLQDERNTAILNYIIVNEKKYESLEGMKYLVVDNKVKIKLLDSIFDSFPKNLQNSPIGKWLTTKIDQRKKYETISSYDLALLNLKFVDVGGRQITLNGISSEYILLDFWASWCAPCRYENRKLVKEKKSLLKKGNLSIVAVSLDTNKEKWINASREDGLDYLTICDFKALESPLTKSLNITVVPYNLLIDKRGNIIANNLWGKELKVFLESL